MFRARAFLVPAGSFAVALTAVVAFTVKAQHDTFTYAIDDAAIHMSLARNLASHGTFGLVPGVYESASSAPLWELLLVPVVRLAPGALWLPLVANIVAALWLLRSFSRLAVIETLSRRPAGTAALVALPFGLGLVPLVMTGMEHTLHAAIVVQLLALLVDRLREPVAGRARIAWFALLALGTLVRFETMFVAAGLAVALLTVRGAVPARQRLVAAGATLAAAAAPAAMFAAINRSFGQYALPNSVVAKTPLGRDLPIPRLDEVVERVVADPLLIVLALAAAICLVQLRKTAAAEASPPWAGPPTAMLIALVLHLALADVGWFERYQAYLVAGLAFAVLGGIERLGWLAPGRLPRVAILIVAVSILRVPLLINTPAATYNVYENQYQLGELLGRNYQGRSVAVNDIGYVSWNHDGDLVDVAGLGSFDVLEARKEGRFDAAFTAELFREHQVEVLVIYDEFFKGIVPAGWDHAGRWCFTSRRMVLSSDCVTFYAPHGGAVERLRAALRSYQASLPEGVDAQLN
jgi:hypothetical protein